MTVNNELKGLEVKGDSVILGKWNIPEKELLADEAKCLSKNENGEFLIYNRGDFLKYLKDTEEGVFIIANDIYFKEIYHAEADVDKSDIRHEVLSGNFHGELKGNGHRIIGLDLKNISLTNFVGAKNLILSNSSIGNLAITQGKLFSIQEDGTLEIATEIVDEINKNFKKDKYTTDVANEGVFNGFSDNLTYFIRNTTDLDTFINGNYTYAELLRPLTITGDIELSGKEIDFNDFTVEILGSVSLINSKISNFKLNTEKSQVFSIDKDSIIENFEIITESTFSGIVNENNGTIRNARFKVNTDQTLEKFIGIASVNKGLIENVSIDFKSLIVDEFYGIAGIHSIGTIKNCKIAGTNIRVSKNLYGIGGASEILNCETNFRIEYTGAENSENFVYGIGSAERISCCLREKEIIVYPKIGEIAGIGKAEVSEGNENYGDITGNAEIISGLISIGSFVKNSANYGSILVKGENENSNIWAAGILGKLDISDDDTCYHIESIISHGAVTFTCGDDVITTNTYLGGIIGEVTDSRESVSKDIYLMRSAGFFNGCYTGTVNPVFSGIFKESNYYGSLAGKITNLKSKVNLDKTYALGLEGLEPGADEKFGFNFEGSNDVNEGDHYIFYKLTDDAADAVNKMKIEDNYSERVKDSFFMGVDTKTIYTLDGNKYKETTIFKLDKEINRRWIPFSTRTLDGIITNDAGLSIKKL